MHPGTGRKNKKLFVNSILYSFTSLFTKALGFFMLPVYTNLLATEGYGSVELVVSFVAVASYIGALSLYSAILRFHSEYSADRERLTRFYSSVFLFLPISGLAFAGICLAFRRIISEKLLSGLPVYPMVLLGIGLVFFSMLHTAHISFVQASQDGRRLSLLNICVSLCQAALTLFLLTVVKAGAAGILLSQLIVYALYSVYAYADLAKRGLLRFRIDGTVLRSSLRYSVPMLPHNLSGNIADYASKLFLSASASLGGVGLYGAASKFGLVIDTIQTAGNQAFMPWFFEELRGGREEDRENIGRAAKALLLFYSMMYMCIGLFSEEAICLLLGTAYHEAWRVVPIIVAAFSVKSVYYFLVTVLMYHRETSGKIFLGTITGSLSEILLLSVLVPRFGMYGTAASLLFAKIVTVAILARMARPFRDLPLGAWRLFLCVLPGLAFLAAGILPSYAWFDTGIHPVNVAYKCLCAAAFLLLQWRRNRALLKELSGSGGFLRRKGF